jgi:hypothetical protein
MADNITVPRIGPKEFAALLRKSIPARLPILIVGMPGIGKTAIPTQIVEELGYKLQVVHPVVSDPTDVKGMPWVVKEAEKYVAKFIPFNDLKAMIDATEPLVVFFDDLGQAPPTVQAAIMQLLLARKINDHKVSDYVTFIAASNRKSDMAAVTGMLEPVKSRFATIMELTVDNDAWNEWAVGANLDYRLRAFLRYKPELLCAFKPNSDMQQSPIPRTIHNLDYLIKLNLEEDGEGVEFAAYGGAVGIGFTKEFIAFCDIYQNIQDIKRVLTKPSSVDVPSKPDVKHAVISMLVGMAERQYMENIMKYVDRFPIEFQAVFVSDIELMKEKLCETKAMIDWKVRNGDLHI